MFASNVLPGTYPNVSTAPRTDLSTRQGDFYQGCQESKWRSVLKCAASYPEVTLSFSQGFCLGEIPDFEACSGVWPVFCFKKKITVPRPNCFGICSALDSKRSLSFCVVSRAVFAQVMNKNFLFVDGASIVFVGLPCLKSTYLKTSDLCVVTVD